MVRGDQARRGGQLGVIRLEGGAVGGEQAGKGRGGSWG